MIRPMIRSRRAAGAALLLALAGLAQARDEAPDSPTLARIRATGVVTLGYRADSAPFSYLDERRRPVGYSLEICQRIVDAVRTRLNQPRVEVRWVLVTTATRLPRLAIGSIDLECGVTTNTAARQAKVAFSVTTFVAASRLLARRDSGIRTLDDLRGRSVVSTLSTTSIEHLTAENDRRGLEMHILASSNDADAFRRVRIGEALAFAMDDVLLRNVLAAAPDRDDYTISDEPLTVEPYAIGLPRGDALYKQLVDDAIVALYRSGEIRTIYRKWFESPIPNRGMNFELPMSKALERAIAQPTDSPDPRVYR